MSELSEKEIQKQIEDYLRAKGWFVWRSPHVPRKPGHNYQGTTGEPDIKAVRNRDFVAIEVKKPGGSPTTKQAEFIGNIQRQGFLAFVAKGLDDVIQNVP